MERDRQRRRQTRRALKTYSGTSTSSRNTGMPDGVAAVDTSVAVTHTAKYVLITPPGNTTPGHYTSETKTYFPTKTSVGFYSSFIPYHQKERGCISNSMLVTQLHVFIKICKIIPSKA